MIFVTVILGFIFFVVFFFFGLRLLRNSKCGTTIANIPYSGIFPDSRMYKIIDGRVSEKDLLERYRAAKGVFGVSIYLNSVQTTLIGFTFVTIGFISFVSIFVLGMISA